MSPQERGATMQGFNGREIPPEATKKILDVLDKTVDQFLAAKQAQRLEKDLPTRVLEDGTKEWRNEAGELHREKGPAIEYADEGYQYYRNGQLHREDGPAEYLAGNRQAYYRDGLLHREDGPALKSANGEQKWYRSGELHREDGPAIRDSSQIAWYKNGQLHCEDGPAVVRVDGTIEFYLNGQHVSEREIVPAMVREDGTQEWHNEKGELHREHGPAVIYEDGSREYYQKGLLHRENGPARVEITDNVAVSYAEYRIRGELHREDGPAIERDTGEKEYYRHGKLHREDGPAIERPDGTKEYYLNGEKTTAAELCKSLGISSSAQTESRNQETLEKAATEDLRIAKESFPQHFQSEKNKAYLENARKTNEFMDRPLPPGNGAAREYCVEARKAIALNGQWPGKSADENIAKKLLQQGHDKSKIVEAIRGKSPEMVGRDLNESRAYAKELVDRALTPEVKKERQRGVSRDR